MPENMNNNVAITASSAAPAMDTAYNSSGRLDSTGKKILRISSIISALLIIVGIILLATGGGSGAKKLNLDSSVKVSSEYGNTDVFKFTCEKDGTYYIVIEDGDGSYVYDIVEDETDSYVQRSSIPAVNNITIYSVKLNSSTKYKISIRSYSESYEIRITDDITDIVNP